MLSIVECVSRRESVLSIVECVSRRESVDLIDYRYKPFMAWFNDAMNQINTQVEQNDATQAISKRKAFLSELGPEYEQNKIMLEQMTDLIGKLTLEL